MPIASMRSVMFSASGGSAPAARALGSLRETQVVVASVLGLLDRAMCRFV
jgi:hypothetical protein